MHTRRIPPACTVCLAGLLSFSIWGAALGKEAQPPSISASNLASLRENVGKQVTVVGLVERTGQSRSGHQFLNFANSELTVVCYPEHVANFRDGKPAEVYRHQDVEIVGKVELYQGKVQLRLRSPDQIRIASPAQSVPAKGIQLKEIGKETWLSPVGLRYRGRDPEGLTRVEHIGRHTRDIPDRDGPHGVFDGGADVAFAVIDEAWQLAQKGKLRPQREGGRRSYTVDMQRRVGFLGGRTGGAQKHPPLSHVFIVFTTGTQDIITAFPK